MFQIFRFWALNLLFITTDRRGSPGIFLRKGNGVKDRSMIAYEFYWHGDGGEAHLLGILPERRKDRRRITEESIMKWGNLILGNQANTGSIYFIRVEV